MHGQTEGGMDGWADGQTEGGMHGWMDGRTDGGGWMMTQHGDGLVITYN